MEDEPVNRARAYLDFYASEIFDAAREVRSLDDKKLKTAFDNLPASVKQAVRNEFFRDTGTHFKW